MKYMQIRKAVRKAIPAIICLYGKSGGGKTYSALKLAQGLVGKDRICLIDTENGRASHYADEFDFDIIDLCPPFSPARYIQAIKTAQDNGYKAIVIDSISHEWEGMGGCLEMAEGKTGLLAWAKPKEQHRKMMNMLLQSKSHIIFCARAKDNLEQVKIDGKAEIINHGLMPIQEKNFPFEMLITLRMQDKGKVVIEKCIKGLEESLKINGYINENHGKIIADWINKGEGIDFKLKSLHSIGNEIAMNGNLEALTSWFKSLSKEEQLMLHNKGITSDLKNICNERSSEVIDIAVEYQCISEEQIDVILELLKKQNKIAPNQVLEIYKVETFQEIPLSKFDVICKKIQQEINDKNESEIGK
jgi:hypothetical protein